MAKSGADNTESVVVRDDDIVQRAINAAAQCIDTLGLEKTSVDDIAREAGISRATLYRRFGNRESILTALLMQQSRPIVDACIGILARHERLAERVEECLIHAVTEALRNRFLKAVFDSGASRSNMELIRPICEQLIVAAFLPPMLQSARANGELREGLDDREILEWLVRDFLLMLADMPLATEQLRRRVRQFVLPVLIAEPRPASAPAMAVQAEDSLESRLARMEQRLTEMQQMLGLMRQDFLEHKSPARGR